MKGSKALLLFVALTALTLEACDPKGDGEGDAATEMRGDAGPGDPCNGTIDCTPGSICYSNICVQEGTLRFSLSWDEDTDFDLHVLTPAGNEIYFSTDMADGGELDVDDCIGGACTQPDGDHVENVFFVDSAEHGDYGYWVENFSGEVMGEFTLVVAEDGVVQARETGTLPAEMVESDHFSYTY